MSNLYTNGEQPNIHRFSIEASDLAFANPENYGETIDSMFREQLGKAGLDEDTRRFFTKVRNLGIRASQLGLQENARFGEIITLVNESALYSSVQHGDNYGPNQMDQDIEEALSFDIRTVARETDEILQSHRSALSQSDTSARTQTASESELFLDSFDIDTYLRDPFRTIQSQLRQKVSPRLTYEEQQDAGREVQDGISAKEELDNQEISQDQMRHLEDRITAGEKAKQLLIMSNLKLVPWMAVKMKINLRETSHLEMVDLLQAGFVGLVQSAETYKPGYSAKFSTYAVRGIYYGMRRELDFKDRTIKVSQDLANDMRFVEAFSDQLQDQTATVPTAQEIMELVEGSMTEEEVEEITQIINQEPIPLEDAVDEEVLVPATLDDEFESRELEIAANRVVLDEYVDLAIQTGKGEPPAERSKERTPYGFYDAKVKPLSQREINVLFLRYRVLRNFVSDEAIDYAERQPWPKQKGKSYLTLDEVAIADGEIQVDVKGSDVTRERIRQLELRALYKISAAFRRKFLSRIRNEDEAEPW